MENFKFYNICTLHSNEGFLEPDPRLEKRIEELVIFEEKRKKLLGF